jgi:hypothetical protein
MRRVRLVLALAAAAAAIVRTVEASSTTSSTHMDTHVEKLVVIHRHGSRTRLLKAHADLAEGGATLTPLGQRQLYQVRVWA